MNANSIMLTKKNLTYLGTMPGSDADSGIPGVLQDNTNYVATAVKNLENLGYTISENVISCLCRSSVDAITKWYQNTIGAILEAKGGNVQHRPMYKGFPEEVMEMSEAELYINAIIHYIGRYQYGVCIMPHSKDIGRFPLIHNKELIVLDIAIEDDVHEYCWNLITASTSISAEDKNTIKWYINEFGLNLTFADEMPHKENRSIVLAEIFKKYFDKLDIVKNSMETVTDILRFVVALCDGDVSLAERTKFRNFKRSERRFILSLIENLDNSIMEDLYRHRTMWLRLGEKLHPGEYSKKFPTTVDYFNYLRNEKWKGFNSTIEQLIEAGEIDLAATKLSSRPGEFARRLDKLCRESDVPNNIVKTFESIADRISTAVLIQVCDHFENRNTGLTRFAMPKSNTASLVVLPDVDKKISNRICSDIICICENTLMNRFSALGDLGKIYIDPKLDNFLLPTSQRSASRALKTAARGSKFDIDEGNTLRFFIYWKGYDDIDLSATFFDKNWNKRGHNSYTNLKNETLNCCHSGDITTAPNGASEFIDMDINKLDKYGIRYVALNVLIYSGTKFADMEECFGGWMLRQNDTGEIYEPKTVQNKFDISCDSRTVLPAIFDVKERKVIWCDIAYPGSTINCVENNMSAIQLIGETLSNMNKMTLHRLFVFHGVARNAKIVDDREEADLVFAEDGDITPYDFDVIASEYMA